MKDEVMECPRCLSKNKKVKMTKLEKDDVVIDICRKCGGMWLDEGELEKLAVIGKRIRKESHLKDLFKVKKIKN